MTYLRYGLTLFFILSQMTSCSDSDSVSSNQSKDDPAAALPGMMRISAENAVVQLGTNEVSAKANERPQMSVALNYKFSIGKYEVTCSEFNDLMKPATGLKLDCDDKDFPATDLTYYGG